MTKYVIFADGADGMLQHQGTTYAIARSNTGTFSQVTNDLPVGQRTFSASVWQCLQIYLSFSLASLGANERITSAVADLTSDGGDNGPDSELVWYEWDWGASVTSADWRTGFQLTSLNEVGANFVAAAGSGVVSKTRLHDALPVGSTARFLVAERNQEDNVAPTTATSIIHFRETETSGTASDPKLTLYTIANDNALAYVGHGLIELSDGSFVSLRSNGAALPTVTLEHSPDGVTWSSIATVPTGSSSSQFLTGNFNQASMNALGLCRDSSNNLYVYGFNGSTKRVAVKAYTKGTGYSWSAQNMVTVAGARDTAENLGAAALWVDSGAGTNDKGHIVLNLNNASNMNFTVAAGSFFGSWRVYALDAGVALAGSGTLLASVRDFGDNFEFVGDGRDMEYRNGVFGENNVAISVLKHTFYTAKVEDDGTVNVFTSGPIDATNGTPTAPTLTGETKRRLIYAAGNPWIINDNSHGTYANNAGNFMITSRTGIRRESATSSGSMLATNFSEPSAGWAWDAFYDPINQKIWVYYLDSTNTRTLRRTSFSLVSNAWVGDSTTASASIGASGTTNRAIRVIKRPSTMDRILVEVANVSGSVHTLYRYTDAINASPLAPTLDPVTAFDRSVSKLFSWVFNDPDVGDRQTAYRVEISNNSTGVSAVNTGKVTSSASNYTLPASTLTNEVTYRWRATTWDSRDNTGLTSDWQTFEVSSRPTATITSTAPADTPSYILEWSYAQAGGSPQAAYRVRKLTAGGIALSDSGWLPGAGTSYTVTNIPSGVNTTIELTVRSVKGVESLAATQVVNPTYLAPSNPVITSIVRGVAGNIIAVLNPPPAASAQLAPEYNELWRYPPRGVTTRGTRSLPGVSSDDDNRTTLTTTLTTIVGTPATFSVGSNSLTVPAGVTRDMTVIVVATTADGASFNPQLSGVGTFTRLDDAAANNMRAVVFVGRGVQAGDLITPVGSVKQCHWAHIYTDTWVPDVSSLVSATRGGVSQAFVTSPPITPTVGQKVLIIAAERTTADGTTVSSVVSSPAETVSQISYNEEAAATDTSIYVGTMDITSADPHTVTVTHSSGSGNGYVALMRVGSIAGFTYERVATQLPVCGTYLDADVESVGGDVRYFVRAVSNAGG